MLPSVLADLIEFHAPLSVVQREQGGAVTLLTPGVNVLALNATFLPGDVTGVNLRDVQDWHEGQGLPPLMAWAGADAPAGLAARPVARVWVGDWAGQPEPLDAPAGEQVVVEQVSRLHLSAWAEALCAAHGTPGWAAGLARQLAGPLEAAAGAFALLMAYRDGQPVGSLLWQARGAGGAAHLWGAADAGAGAALLDAAAALGDGLRVTVPDGWAGLDRHESVTYALLTGEHDTDSD
ncbi:hypothetical protein [Deinococcus knuensis]|uniref:N-acetyltransferase domain-containing protein n=1 Tax=Deinococcus knuensis TaxID=1837380 RepID=A0ABQ2SJP4_9DEIO|nr:hypothetical protein [Deinococcus knuensis]GGS31525.1 hypothetical protein GCM10008961_24200 [Deinococcus knuensis]